MYWNIINLVQNACRWKRVKNLNIYAEAKWFRVLVASESNRFEPWM